MSKLFLLPCIALLTAAAPATSAPPAVSNQVAPSDSQQSMVSSGGGGTQAVAEKKICKQLPVTGSRFAKRACLTANEWKQVDAEVER